MPRSAAIAGPIVCALLVLAPPAAVRAQTMQETLNSLFVFSGGRDPLFLGGSADAPATSVHGAHFIPGESEANASVLAFFNGAISRSVATFPLSSTAASETFTFVGGVPTPTSNSFGPIFAERGQTLGRGRLNAGFNYSRLRFSSIRGLPLDRVQLAFVHDNSDFPNCDEIFGGDCTDHGVPQFEHDVLGLTLDLDLEAEVFAFHATFGLADWLDLGVAIPVVDMRLAGRSTAEIIPSTGGEVLHFFGGTPEAPVLSAETQAFGQTTGVGDIAGRIKARLLHGEALDLALLGEARVPTGREEDFLGTGSAKGRVLFISSAVFGEFSPHMNVGYVFSGSELDQDAVELVAGFDGRLSNWATLAVDLLAAFKLGDEKIVFPEPVLIGGPYQKRVRRTNIPDRRDDILDGSFGFKFRAASGLVMVANVLVPLNEGGLRSAPIPTLGVEFTR